MMRQERGLVIKDLLCLLKSVQEIHIEPNGASFERTTFYPLMNVYSN